MKINKCEIDKFLIFQIKPVFASFADPIAYLLEEILIVNFV